MFAGLAATVLLVIAGPGYRIGVLPLQPALLGAALGFLLFIMAFLLGGVGLLAGRVRSLPTSHAAIAVVVVAGLATIFGGSWMVRLRSAPPIHDITTDTEDPPAFRAIVPMRQAAQAANAPEYQRIQRVGGRDIDVIEAQRTAYPDVQPLILPQTPEQALELARQAAQALGWQIVAADMTTPLEGRIEATDTTAYFGFKDDMVIRVRPEPNGSRVDARSVSRVGVSDVGTNARRIRNYMTQLRDLAGMQ
ncbi:MAG: DUF1499 domain-containing protein [Dehalococcoidia bacterium]